MSREAITEWSLLAVAASLLFGSLSLPLWKMRMEAPQYRDEEALKIIVYPGSMKGDLNELKTLNQYIGVHTPETLPQFAWLPGVIIGGAVAGLFFPIFARKSCGVALWIAPLVISVAIGFVALQAKSQMYELGHDRAEKTIMRGVKDFTPPFLGHARVAQFDINSWFGFGSYLIGAGIALQLTAAWLHRGRKQIAAPSGRKATLARQRQEAFA